MTKEPGSVMTKEEREEIRKRVDDAPSDPWYVMRYNEDYGQGYRETTYFVDVGADILKIGIGNDVASCKYYNSIAEFIAYARQDIPALLDALDKAETRVKALEEAIVTWPYLWQ